MFKEYDVYIMTNEPRGTLYIGFSGNLTDRVKTHKAQSVEGFTQEHGLTRLVYYKRFGNPTDAIKYEKKLKHWPRQWKINLIETENPHWVDLAHNW